MEISIYAWIGFILFVAVMLILDLGVFNRKSHEVKIKEALIWSAVWISLSLVFNVIIYFYLGKVKALEFLSGYLIEKSLSVDNLFVFILLFKFFNVPKIYHHKVLFWGIMGAIVMRAIFIFAGVALINKFHWLIYIFGIFLIFTGIKMLFPEKSKIDPEKNTIVRLFKRFFPVTNRMYRGHFFIRKDAKYFATPLFIALIVVEVSDLIFAVDSIPAILAISNDTFIIFTSNIFAILGLRALYFALAGITQYFYYLKYGLAAILSFVGIKMIISGFYKIPVGTSLAVIFVLLVISILMSVIFKKSNSVV